MHLLMCRHCHRYVKQLDLIKTGFIRLFESKYKSADESKIHEIEKQVLEKVNKNR